MSVPLYHALSCDLPFQMEFYVHDINTDVLEVTVFDKDLFSPNGESIV